jgi:hypothetical protein
MHVTFVLPSSLRPNRSAEIGERVQSTRPQLKQRHSCISMVKNKVWPMALTSTPICTEENFAMHRNRRDEIESVLAAMCR